MNMTQQQINTKGIKIGSTFMMCETLYTIVKIEAGYMRFTSSRTGRKEELNISIFSGNYYGFYTNFKP